LLSSKAEVERIRTSLVLTAEVLAAQLIVDAVQASPIKLAHLAIRLPAVVTRMRRLIVACEAMLDRIATAENRLLAGMALDIGVGAGLVISPPVQVSAGLEVGKTKAPANLATIAERMTQLQNRGLPSIRVERYADSVIAYLPGTRSGSFGWTGNPMDMTTNLQAIAGRRNNVELGLQSALAAAGVRPNDRVMLVGHSQGGLVAIAAAHHSKAGSFPFQIEKVITFGSPVGANYPETLPKVLSVENRFDLVPNLDRKRNPQSPNWLTLAGNVVADPISAHRMEAYQQISTQIDRTGSAADFLNFNSGEASVTYFELSQGKELLD
jgi:hypothetical protein